MDVAIVTNPQYGVAGCLRNPFKLCDFPLVTKMSLLY